MHIIFAFALLLGTGLLPNVKALPINHDCEDAEECGNLILTQRTYKPYHSLPVPTPLAINRKQLGGPIHAINSLKRRELSEDDPPMEDCKRSTNDASSEVLSRRCGGDGGGGGGGGDGGGDGSGGGGGSGGDGSDGGSNNDHNGPPGSPSNPDSGDEGEYGGMDADQLIAAADAAAPSDPNFWQSKAFCLAWQAVFGSLLDGTCDFLRPLPPSGGGGGGSAPAPSPPSGGGSKPAPAPAPAPAPTPPASGGKKSIGGKGGRPQRRGVDTDTQSLEREKS